MGSSRSHQVVVRNGVVHLSGRLVDERQRGRSARPRKTSPELRPSKTILSGSTRCPGSLSTHFEEEAEREPPAA